MKSRACTISVSKDERELCWEYQDSLRFNFFSKKSCAIRDVEGILLGPSTHTFRAYRLQNLLIMASEDKESIPEFYGWQCISVKLQNRTIDFVIDSREDLICFIQGMEILLLRSQAQLISRVYYPIILKLL